MLIPHLLVIAAPVTVNVTTAVPTRGIWGWIYGTNEGGWTGSNRFLALGRQGGNRMTAYNWENNASNAGSDWFNQNDDYLGGGNVPGEVPRRAVADAFSKDKAFIVTIPLAGYVAADKNGGGDVNQTPNYLNARFRPSYPRKGGAFAYPPDLNDGAVYQDEFVKWLESKFPASRPYPIFYSLDNEPDLWAYTHSRIHPNPATYAEMVSRTADMSSAIKAVAPSALVFGFVSYGYNGYTTLQNAPDAGGRNFVDFYLDSMSAAGASAGKRLLDVLDLHWYPEAQGNGQRITGNDVSPAGVQARVQAPRSLWDPTYTETSWITQWVTGGPIKLIPTLRNQIAAHYPGTKLAFTEYNYGASNHISGALAQADALGVFGREGVFAACYWPLQGDNRFVHAAFDVYRNYDGARGEFGDASLPATSSNIAEVTAYAAKFWDGRPGTTVVLINKSISSTPVTIKIDVKVTSVKTYTLAGTNPRVLPSELGKVGERVATLNLPALSVNMVVLK